MKALQIIGPPIYSVGSTVFEPGVATLFPDRGILVTKGTMHMIHREVYCEFVEKERSAAGKPPLTARERSHLWKSGVDLIILPDDVLIRPDPNQIVRVLAADQQLQQIVNKRRIRFLLASHDTVRGALTERGDIWRIASDAVTTDEMKASVQDSRMKLGGRAIYYYSPPTGTRCLTLNELKNLGELPADELRQYMLEIQKYCNRYSNRGGPEVGFFQTGHSLKNAFRDAEFPDGDEAALRAEYQRLYKLFQEGVLPHLRVDDLNDAIWLEEMYEALYPLQDDAADAAKFLGLALEFQRHIKWLPGGILKQGHLDYDSVYDGANGQLPDDLQGQEYRRARAIILNFARDYGNLKHINVGWINESLAREGRPERGRRDVYVVEMKRANERRAQVRILRMQKWDMKYRLDEGKSLELAMLETEKYTEYTQDRYLGCRRLGMNLFGPMHIGKISELYRNNPAMPIWTPYFERAYIDGIASDKIATERWSRPGYAERFADLLGRAAAPNIIVGRGDGNPRAKADDKLVVFFDDGDEIVVEQDDMVKELVVVHHTGSFWHFEEPLRRFASAYARPAVERMEELPDPDAFARIYLNAMIERFTALQQEYRDDRRAFDQLFNLRHLREEGDFANRWQCVLDRLEKTNPAELKEAIAAAIAAGS